MPRAPPEGKAQLCSRRERGAECSTAAGGNRRRRAAGARRIAEDRKSKAD